MTGYAKSTYQHLPQPGQPHYTEAWALIEAARRMADVIKDGIPEDIKDRNAVRDALRLNWRLWTIFQAELSITVNADVSDDVRENMLTLCKFVDQHTAAILSDPTPESIITLVDINRNIASGLLELSEAEIEAEAQDEPSNEPYQPKGPQEQLTANDAKKGEAGEFSFDEDV